MNDLYIFSLQHMHIGHQQHHFKEPEPLRWEISCGMNNALKEMNDNSELQPLDTMILLYSTVGSCKQINGCLFQSWAIIMNAKSNFSSHNHLQSICSIPFPYYRHSAALYPHVV